MAGEIQLAGGGGGGGNGSRNLDETAPARLGGGGGGNGSSTSETKRRHLFGRVEKKEEQILKMEATVFQVANYNLVFQGVILAAITNGSTALRCSLFWLPFSLSAVGSVLNFGILWMNAAKYKAALDELDKRRLVVYKDQFPNSGTDELENSHRRNEKFRQRILVLSVILFCIFAALNLLAASMIPCWSRLVAS